MANKFIVIAFDKEGKVVQHASCAHQTENEIRQHAYNYQGELLYIKVVDNAVQVLEHRLPEVAPEPEPVPEPVMPKAKKKAKKKGD